LSILLLILLGFEEFQKNCSLKFHGCCTEQQERDYFVLSGFNREAKQANLERIFFSSSFGAFPNAQKSCVGKLHEAKNLS